jgi:hypothetical protein
MGLWDIGSVSVLIGGPMEMHFVTRTLDGVTTKLLEGDSLKCENTLCLPMESQRLGEI